MQRPGMAGGRCCLAGWALWLVVVGLSSSAGGAVPGGLQRAAGYREGLERVARSLEARWQVRLYVDPAIRPAVPSREPADVRSLPEGLDALAGALKGSAWRRVYTRHDVAGEAHLEALTEGARTIERVSFAGLGIENPANGRWSLLRKNVPAGQNSPLGANPRVGEALPLYLLYSTAPGEEAGSVGLQMASLQRQQLETPVGEGAQPLAYARIMQLIQALPPGDREVFARRTVEASMQTWFATPGEQRRDMIRQTFGLLQQLGVTGDAPGTPHGQPSPAARPAMPARPRTRTYLAELKTLARQLAEQHRVRVAIDPELFVAQAPRRPAADLPVEKAIAALVRPLTGVAWRAVYLSEADYTRLEDPKTAEALATDVRRIELHEGPSLELVQERRGQSTLYLRDLPVTERSEAERMASGLGKQRVYVLFSTTPSASGETPEERFADLQRQQIGLMLRMSPAQLGQAMQQLIDSFGSLDPAAQKRVLGLPMMAGMMAGWFPRHAKENQ